MSDYFVHEKHERIKEKKKIMCQTCYLATDREIAEIPFDDNDPTFYTVKEEEHPVGLTKKYVYFCGSFMGCGCGLGMWVDFSDDFLSRMQQERMAGKISDESISLWRDQYPGPPDDDTLTEFRCRRRDTLALYDLIRKIREAGDSCEVLIGPNWLPPDEIYEVKPEEEVFLDFYRDHAVGQEDTPILYRFLK